MKLRKIAAVLTGGSLLISAAAPIAASAEGGTPTALAGDFVIADTTGAANIVIDSTGADYDGLSIIADTFAGDVKAVTNKEPEVKTSLDGVNGMPIIAGTAEDTLIRSLKGMDLGELQNADGSYKNEVYKIQVVDNPADNISKALVIAGSDKRGVIYGIFHISEMMGVSPWIYWGDVTPEHKDVVSFNADELSLTSGEPSVKYRGIFLNDEAPNLTGWADNAFDKHFGPEFYGKVFELILRLKGNYLWPAMWSNEFYKEGERGSAQLEEFKKAMKLTQGALDNAQLADKYGVVMGTSHHEPMGRAGNEWAQEHKQYLTAEDAKIGSAKTWDYNKYAYALDGFWKDGYTRMKDFEEIVTIGMRGEADSALSGTLDDNIQNLKNVITSQFKIMDEENQGKRPPTMLALYKEVEDFWLGRQGGEVSENPLKDWTVDGESPLKDTVIMLTNDNFGNVRTLPDDDEREGKYGGWGMYYHFDYNGGPRSYRWVSSVQLEKIWQNMTDAYNYGVDDIWIVNVGDLKPHELEISYFLNLAYDMDTWGQVNKTDDYVKQWTAKQFGQSGVDDETVNAIAQLQSDYLKLNATRRAEVVFPDTYSIVDSNELYGIIDRARNIYKRAEELENTLPESMRDSYYNLVGYAAKGSANVTLLNAYSALAKMYSASGSLLANVYSQLMNDGLTLDHELTTRYNEEMSQGKWNGMMHEQDPVHIGAGDWGLSSENAKLPSAYYVKPTDGAQLIVHADGSKKEATSGSIDLPAFTSTNKEAYSITVSNGGKEKLDYTAAADADWIKLSKTSGSVYAGESIGVTVDWNNLTKSSTGAVTIASGDQTVTVNVKADIIETAGLENNTFIGKNGIISIEAEHYAAANGMITVYNLGKNLSTIRTADYTNIHKPTDKNAPYAQYKLKVDKAGEYTVTVIAGPSNPRTITDTHKYYIKVNNGDAIENTTIDPAKFIAGDNGNAPWCSGVLQNAHISSMKVNLNAGVNTITFYPSNSAVVLQKLVVSESGREYVQRDGGIDKGNEFIGPAESYYVGKKVEQQAVKYPTVEDKMTIPGKLTTGGKVIITKTGSYEIKAEGMTDAAVVIELDGSPVMLENGGDGVYIADLTMGEYQITFTGAESLTFEHFNLIPGIVIDHPMTSPEDIDAYKSGYKNRLDTVTVREASFADGGMKYTTENTYGSSGFKYDITSIVNRVIKEYGEDTEFTLSMDVKSNIGSNPRIGFMNNSEEIAVVPMTGVNKDSYTTLTCKATLSGQNKVYFFLCAEQPSSSVRNVKITYPAPVKNELFTHNFSNEEQFNKYESYIKGDGNLSYGGRDITVSGFKNGYTETNGIKTEITEYVKGLSGYKFGASADINTTAGGKARLFIEVVPESGEPTQYILSTGERQSETDGNIALNGELENVTFDSTDKVYLCVTQWSGWVNFDNIALWAYKIETPKTTVEVFRHTFKNDSAPELELYKAYDDSDTAKIGKGNSSVLRYQNGTSEKKGVRLDITEDIKKLAEDPNIEFSKLMIGASMFIKPGNGWSSSSNARISFEKMTDDGLTEIAAANAVSTDFETGKLYDSDTSSDLGSGWNLTPIRVETKDISVEDKVYLCITSDSATQYIDDVTLYYYETNEGGKPVIPPEDETLTLYDSVKDGVTGWAVYDLANTDASISDYGNGKIGVQYGNDHSWDGNNGVKLDVTDYIRQCGSSKNFEVEYTLGNGALKGNNDTLNKPSVFFEVNGEKTELTLSSPTSLDDIITSTNPNSVKVKAVGVPAFKDSDTVYLCFTHGAGYHEYSDIVLKGTKKASEPDKKLSVTNPIIDDTGVYVFASNTTDEAAEVKIYIAKYNEDKLLETVDIVSTTVASGDKDKKISFTAAEGDTIFIWDNNMDPLTATTVLRPTA